MPEGYGGVKFKTLFTAADFAHPKERVAVTGELAWMDATQLLHGIPGNVSVRAKEGLVITPTGKDLAEVKAEDMVLVTGVNESALMVTAAGRLQPSSEAMMHWLAYKEFPKANAIVHFHDDRLLGDKRFAETEKEHPYGTLELAHAAVKALKKSKFIVLKGHGGLAVGKDFKSCNALIEKVETSLK